MGDVYSVRVTANVIEQKLAFSTARLLTKISDSGLHRGNVSNPLMLQSSKAT